MRHLPTCSCHGRSVLLPCWQSPWVHHKRFTIWLANNEFCLTMQKALKETVLPNWTYALFNFLLLVSGAVSKTCISIEKASKAKPFALTPKLICLSSLELRDAWGEPFPGNLFFCYLLWILENIMKSFTAKLFSSCNLVTCVFIDVIPRTQVLNFYRLNKANLRLPVLRLTENVH